MYKITQLSIFLENKRGNLYNTLDLLAENNINIRALSLADTTEFGILRLVVQDPIKAKKILEEHWYIVKNTPIIGTELDDTPGGLSSVLKILNDEEIDLEYLYAFTHEKTEKAILLLQAEDLDNLINILTAYKVPLVPAEEVYNLWLNYKLIFSFFKIKLINQWVQSFFKILIDWKYCKNKKIVKKINKIKK